MSRRKSRFVIDLSTRWTGLVTGASVLAIGLLMWMDRLHRLHAGDYLRWWPLTLIALGLAHLPRREWVQAAALGAIGLLFMPRLPFLPHAHLYMIFGMWPLLISVSGMTLVMQALRPAAKDAQGAAAIHAIAIMGGTGRSIASESFAGGDAIAVMGACEINLLDARIENEAVIDVVAYWGFIEIRVPRGWKIDNQVTAILGGFADKTSGDLAINAPRLVVRGSAIMGGIEVKNKKERKS